MLIGQALACGTLSLVWQLKIVTSVRNLNKPENNMSVPALLLCHRVEDLLKIVELPGMGDRYSSQISGGQRQRIALARALACSPRWGQ